MKLANEPSSVATPTAIPLACRTTTTQDAAANMSVTKSAIASSARSDVTRRSFRVACVEHLPTTTVGRRHSVNKHKLLFANNACLSLRPVTLLRQLFRGLEEAL